MCVGAGTRWMTLTTIDRSHTCVTHRHQEASQESRPIPAQYHRDGFHKAGPTTCYPFQRDYIQGLGSLECNNVFFIQPIWKSCNLSFAVLLRRSSEFVFQMKSAPAPCCWEFKDLVKLSFHSTHIVRPHLSEQPGAQ